MTISTTASREDNDYLNGLRNNDSKLIQKVYDAYFHRVAAWVKRNNGNLEAAEDVFEEGLIVFYRKSRNPDFVLTSSFYSFLFGVCRNIWQRELKKKYRSEVTLSDDREYKDEHDIENDIIWSERQDLFQEKFTQLKERCQQLLRLFFQKTKMKKIADIMGYQSEGVVKKEKFKCKQRLVQMIKSDPRFNELKL
ncbi:MAG: sigma-70 family RNA polymerase sigma factor [Bacteroidota bacterium]